MACEITYNNKTYTEQEFLTFLRGGGLETPANLSAKNALTKKVRDILNGTSYALHYFGNDIDTVASKKPTEEEITEYQNLLQEKDTKSERFKELRRKLNDWQIIDGTMDNEQNSSLSDYIEMYNALENKTEEVEQIIQVTPTDYDTLDKVDESTERGGFDPYATLSTPDVALAYNPPKSENKIQFSYINIDTLATFFPNHTLVMLNSSGVEVPFESKKEVGTTYIFKGEQDFQVKVVDKARLEMEDRDFAKNSVNVKIKTSGVSAFRTVYKDGNPVQSNFDLKDFNRTIANSLQKGDTLELRVDPNDKYNKQLLEKLKKGEITQTEASSKLNIIMYKDGASVGNFTAIEENPKQFDSLDKNKLIRDKALNEVKDSKTEVTLKEQVKVANTLVGNPNTVLDNKGEIIENDINISHLDSIVSLGVMVDKVAQGKHPKDTIFAYVNSMSIKNKGKKVPFIVIKYLNKNIAFPISLKTQKVDNSQNLLSIITSSLSPSQKSLKAIELLKTLKVDYSGINFVDPMWAQSPQTQEILEKLKTVNTPLIRLEDLKNKNQLVGNTTIGLDLENYPFFNNKILLELPSAEQKPKQKKTKEIEIPPFDGFDIVGQEEITTLPQEETTAPPKEEKVAKKLKQSKGNVNTLTKEETELYTKETKVVEDLKNQTKDITTQSNVSFTIVNPYNFSQTLVFQDGKWGTINPKTKEFQKEYEKHQQYYQYLYQKSLTSFNKITEIEDGQFKREYEQYQNSTRLDNEINEQDCTR